MLVALIAIAGSSFGQDNQAQSAPAIAKIPLWATGTPGKKADDPKDWPALTPYLLPKDQGVHPIVVVCPGGGYGVLAMDHEGHQIAKWLNGIGVSAVILEYRHAPLYQHPIPMMDAMRAIRLVRASAGEWNIDPERIGIIGFSAGGHLVSTVGTHFDLGNPVASDPIDKISSRPNFMILIYPVITFHNDFTHQGTRKNLLGDSPDPALIEYYSNETQISPSTPPAFLVHSSSDKAVPVENSINFFRGLRWAGVPAEMHIFPNGEHGYGLATDDPNIGLWPKHCENWMRQQGFLK